MAEGVGKAMDNIEHALQRRAAHGMGLQQQQQQQRASEQVRGCHLFRIRFEIHACACHAFDPASTAIYMRPLLLSIHCHWNGHDYLASVSRLIRHCTAPDAPSIVTDGCCTMPRWRHDSVHSPRMIVQVLAKYRSIFTCIPHACLHMGM